MTKIQQIFTEHDNWLRYLNGHKNTTPCQIKEVERMLHCRDPENGFWLYYCPKCKDYITIHNSCNSRLCTHCGKRYVDEWANKLRRRLFPPSNTSPSRGVHYSGTIKAIDT